MHSRFRRVLALGAISAGVAAAGELASPRLLALQTGDVDTSAAVNLLDALPDAFDPQLHYVIQLDGPMTPARRDALTAMGMILSDYLPHNAFVAHMAAVEPASLANLDFVVWLGEYAAEWKIDAEVGVRPYATAQRQELAAGGLAAVEIAMFETADVEAGVASVELVSGIVIHRTHWIDDHLYVTATLPLGAVAELSAISEVQHVEDAPEITQRNGTNRWIVQSNVTNDFPLYDQGIHGEGQIIGILDGRPDHDHCSFEDTNPIGPTHRKIEAYNSPLGSETHGTHVAGTSVGDSGTDDNNRGVAYMGRFVFDDIPSFTESASYNALALHHDQGARSHTNSWGDDGTTKYNSLCRGFDDFQYDHEESQTYLAVTNLSTLKNPENAKNLLAVGASEDTPTQNSHCSGGRGPTSDGRRKPEIYAPGCSTNSSRSGTSCSTTQLTGTSMASPAVAATGMLVRQYFMDGFHPSGAANPADAFTPSAALVKATLINSAVDMTGVTGYPSDTEGWGRVLADNALHFAGDAGGLLVEDILNAEGLNTNDEYVVEFDVVSESPALRVTLVWTEPAAASNAALAQVNDLDLEVTDAGGALYLGNVFSSGQSGTGGTRDSKNNLEQVHRLTPTVGPWSVRVFGRAVQEGTQGFALVITGDVAAAGGDDCPADLNGDGLIDLGDLSILLANFGQSGGASEGDLNGDGTVDLADLSLLLVEFGESC